MTKENKGFDIEKAIEEKKKLTIEEVEVVVNTTMIRSRPVCLAENPERALQLDSLETAWRRAKDQFVLMSIALHSLRFSEAKDIPGSVKRMYEGLQTANKDQFLELVDCKGEA